MADNNDDPRADRTKTMSPAACNCQDIPLAQIIVPDGRRSPNPAAVAELAKSIAALGLLNPIGLTKDLRPIYGYGRIAAHEILGRDTIQAFILDLDDLHAQLAAIDENIVRKALTVLDESQALARRKEIYLAMFPETKPVTIKGGPGRGNKTSDNLSPVSYAKDAAKTIGRSARTIQRKVEIAEKLDSEAADMLRGTPHENSLSTLKALADLSVKKQRERAKELRAGAPPRILEKKKRTKYRMGSFVRTGDGVFKLVGRDICGQFQASSHSGGPVTLVPLSAIQGLATKQEWLEARPAANSEQLCASSANAGAGDRAPPDAGTLAGGAAEPPIEGNFAARPPSDPTSLVEKEPVKDEQDIEPAEIANEEPPAVTADQIAAADSFVAAVGGLEHAAHALIARSINIGDKNAVKGAVAEVVLAARAVLTPSEISEIVDNAALEKTGTDTLPLTESPAGDQSGSTGESPSVPAAGANSTDLGDIS